MRNQRCTSLLHWLPHAQCRGEMEKMTLSNFNCAPGRLSTARWSGWRR